MVSRRFFQQMKAIRDLPRLGRALTRGIRIETRAITADNFDFRMPLARLQSSPW